MRRELRKLRGQRQTFTGVFRRYGSKPAYRGSDLLTVLLESIRDTEGNVVADHLWFNLTKGFELLGELEGGDTIQFDARVQRHEKGYQGRRIDVPAWEETDYKLSRPTRISLVAAPE